MVNDGSTRPNREHWTQYLRPPKCCLLLLMLTFVLTLVDIGLLFLDSALSDIVLLGAAVLMAISAVCVMRLKRESHAKTRKEE